jgi:hypothetical protein
MTLVGGFDARSAPEIVTRTYRRPTFEPDSAGRVPRLVPQISGIMSSMKIIRHVIIALALSTVALATSACPEKKGPAEKAGEKIDKAIDETKDTVKDATK